MKKYLIVFTTLATSAASFAGKDGGNGLVRCDEYTPSFCRELHRKDQLDTTTLQSFNLDGYLKKTHGLIRREDQVTYIMNVLGSNPSIENSRNMDIEYYLFTAVFMETLDTNGFPSAIAIAIEKYLDENEYQHVEKQMANDDVGTTIRTGGGVLRPRNNHGGSGGGGSNNSRFLTN